MTRLVNLSERWFRLLQRLYPPDFRDDMGDADDLYYVWRDYGPIIDLKRGAVAGPDLTELRTSSAVIEDVAAFQAFLGGIFALREDADPSEIAVTVVTPNVFELLGVKPMLG